MNIPLSRKLDQFYTNPHYAESFFKEISQHINLDEADILLEPSAGNGSFYNLLCHNKRLGIDVDPKCDGVIKQDFFSWYPKKKIKIISIGNPPFGKNSSLAVKFFNHAASFSEAIAFVLPRTFNKDVIINRLDQNFHLIYNKDTPPNSFIFNNKPYDVWCCAQIWTRQPIKRDKIPIPKLKDLSEWFSIVDPKEADFSIQRVGGAAGSIRTENFRNLSSNSHYFIKQYDARVLGIFQSIDFEPVRRNTAGNPSVSPGELARLWREQAQSRGIIPQKN